MTVTISQLQGVNVGAIRTVSASFSAARKHYDGAERQFHTQVANPIRSGHAWKGKGVSDATRVAEANISALAASNALTEAAWEALQGFATAIWHAKDYLRKTLDAASSKSPPVHVAEDGTVTTTGPVNNFGAPAPGSEAAAHADDIERDIKGCLAFATIADRSCSGILGRVSDLSPSTTDVADPAVLASNSKVLAGALATRNLASLTHDFWSTAKPNPVPKDEDLSRPVKLGLDVINVAGCTAGVVSSLAEDATGVGAVLGLAQGAAAGAGVVNGFNQLSKHAKPDSGGRYKPLPPEQGDKLLNDAYRYGRVPQSDIADDGQQQGGREFTPASTPGQPPMERYGSPIPYSRFTVGSDPDSHEVVVVDQNSGKTYYSDDNGGSFVPVG